ncbi:MAG: hypothetical protein RLY43_389 [Bacteroidota bacterium]|jgi:hypothetical protein
MLTYQHQAVKNAITKFQGPTLSADPRHYFDIIDQIFKTEFNCTINWSILDNRYQRCYEFDTPEKETIFILRFS